MTQQCNADASSIEFLGKKGPVSVRKTILGAILANVAMYRMLNLNCIFRDDITCVYGSVHVYTCRSVQVVSYVYYSSCTFSLLPKSDSPLSFFFVCIMHIKGHSVLTSSFARCRQTEHREKFKNFYVKTWDKEP